MAPKRNLKSKRPVARRVYRKGGKKAHRNIANRPHHIPGTLVPTHMTNKFKYVQTLQKQTPLGTSSVPSLFNQFRLNSIWDPDYTAVTGTSCLGIQQWGQLYQRYRVYKCDYKITLQNLSEDTVVTGAIVPANYLDTTFSVSDYMRPMARRFELGNKSGQNKTTLRGSIYLPKLSGVSSTQYKSIENYASGFSASPSSYAILSVILQTSSGAQAFVAAQVDFTYHTEMMSVQSTPEAVDVTTGLQITPVANLCV